MNRKITALALGLLLVLVPGVFAQMNTGGTQTYTFPRLTVNPGPLTVSGPFTMGGDLTIGATGQLFLPDGTVADPALAFTSDVDTGIHGGTADFTASGRSMKFGIEGQTKFEITDLGTANNMYFYTTLGAGAMNTKEMLVVSATVDLYGYDTTGGTTLPVASAGANTSGSLPFSLNGYFTLGEDMGLSLQGATLDAFSTYVVAVDPTAERVQQLPDLSGTFLIGGANNQLGAVTTTINSGTQFNIHSNENITLDGDADNAGGGTVSLLADNDTQQVLLTNTAVQVVSDGTFGVTVDDATDSSTIVVAPTTLTLDADADTGDAPGTLTLQTDAAAAQVVLSTTSVDINHDTDITLDADTGIANSSLTLDGDGGAVTLSVSDGTDTADYRAGPSSITLDADVDDDGDGTVTLSTDNSANTIVLNSTNIALSSDANVVLSGNDGAGNVSTVTAASTLSRLVSQDLDNQASVTAAPGVITLDADVDAGDTGGTITLQTNTSANQFALGASLLASPVSTTTDVTTTRFGQDDLAWADNAAETLFTFAIADTGLQMGKVRYFSRFNSGGGTLVSNANEAIFACVNEADAEVCSVQAVATEASAVDGDSGVTMACTVGYSAGANAVSITLTCDTSDSSGGTVDWVMESESLTTITAVGS